MATGDGKNGWSNSSSWPSIINRINEIGIPSFIFDFHGLGESDGDYSDLSIKVAVQNLRDATHIVRQQPWVDSSRIGGLGSSFGGSTTLVVQAMDSPFAAVGLKSPSAFLPEAYENEHGREQMIEWKKEGVSPVSGYKYNTYLEAFIYNIYELAKDITSKILIVHGDSDTIVPISQSIRLSYILGDIVELKTITRGTHSYNKEGSLERLINLQTSFFSRHL